VRAAFDVRRPYLFADVRLREEAETNPTSSSIRTWVAARGQVNGLPKTGAPLPSEDRRDAQSGARDQPDDIRGGMGWEGLMELAKFVREGTLITGGATSTIFRPHHQRRHVRAGRTVRSQLGAARRSRPQSRSYGYDAQVPVFRSDPVMVSAVGSGRQERASWRRDERDPDGQRQSAVGEEIPSRLRPPRPLAVAGPGGLVVAGRGGGGGSGA
jgi:hypothetical protein